MKATEVLVAPGDVLVEQVETLGAEIRDRLSCVPGDYLISRPRSRGRSMVVDACSATLVRIFREPKTVVDAVLEQCRGVADDPLSVLDSVTPLIVRLQKAGLLVPADSANSQRIAPDFRPGQLLCGHRLIECVHLFEDVEVHKGAGADGQLVAIKILRQNALDKAGQMLERERTVLERLGGRYAPRLLEAGALEGRAYLITAWCAGTDAASAAKERPNTCDRAALCIQILTSYARLHAQGILHGDVHPGNIRVSSDGSVTLLDFGMSHLLAEDADGPVACGGIAEYMDPEYCLAVSKRHTPRPPAPASEQYSLAAVCYLLLTGSHYVEFSLERDVWIEQVLRQGPRPFAACGQDPWPAVEVVLATALHKSSWLRFQSVSEFETRFREAVEQRPPAALRPSKRHELLRQTVQRYLPVGGAEKVSLVEEPVCSVNYGASGLAYLFYRLASLREDSEMLAAADVWNSWSIENAGSASAFHSQRIHITKETVGEWSLYHSQAGIHCVQGLISHAMGDFYSAAKAARRFLEVQMPEPDFSLDLTVGTSGVLLGLTSLLEAWPNRRDNLPRHELSQAGHRIFDHIWGCLRQESIHNSKAFAWLGIAHGWAGALYAAMRWLRAAGSDCQAIAGRLDELAEMASETKGGMAWPLRVGNSVRDTSSRLGWCHGSAGYAHLWTLAHAMFREERFLRLAEGAANHVWHGHQAGAVQNGSLCCGHAGQGYALLSLYRYTGQTVWLERARSIAERAALTAGKTERPASLYKGCLGAALLAADLDFPELAATPMFESEGWPAER